jgi:two-component system, NtrC family, sensor kinase
MKNTARWLVVAVLAACALALLFLLYENSQGASPAARAAVQENLRLMHQLDSDWNVGVMSAKVGLNDSYDPLVAPIQKIIGLLDRLRSTSAVSAELTALRAAFARKADLVDNFKSHNSILRNSMRYLPAAANEARTALSEVRGPEAALANVVAAAIGVCLEEAARYAVIPEAAQQQRLAQAIASLEDQLRSWPGGGTPRAAAANFLNHTRTVLNQVSDEGELLAGILNVPTVAGIERANAAYESFFAVESVEAERWRQALVAYSAALLLIVGYTGWRLRQSYRQIRRMNAALVDANDTLEHRVQRRTSELAEALASLHESEAQLIQSEKMSSLGQMVAGVAHEINTPLAYVRSSLETVGDQLADVQDLVRHSNALLGSLDATTPDPEQLSQNYAALSELASTFEQHGIVQEMRELSKHGLHGLDQISEIVMNLKNFSRLDRSKTTNFDLREGLESTLSIARGTLKQHQVVKHYGSIPMVECSPSQLNQVFLNLVTNAAQAIEHDHGVITVTTGFDGDLVRVDVQDNGAGIPEENLKRIFDPFFTTKEIGKGTGLGLSIVYKIVQEHGGRIEVASRLGEGTTFTVRLPACAASQTIDPERTLNFAEATA